jgi:NTP pyrophosphatase (non-canonical NTP hydrolase)
MAKQFDRAVAAILTEAEQTAARWNGFNSTHEALGVLIEEFDELRAAIHANSMQATAREAMQVSAVALRLYELCTRAVGGEAPHFKARSGA